MLLATLLKLLLHLSFSSGEKLEEGIKQSITNENPFGPHWIDPLDRRLRMSWFNRRLRQCWAQTIREFLHVHKLSGNCDNYMQYGTKS